MSKQKQETQETYEIHPIGTVHCVEERGEFSLEIFEAHRPALKLLDQFSHVHVFWWFDQLDNEEARSITQAELPYARGTIAGMFACRGPARPNPIALTTTAILGVDEEQGIVRLAWIEAMNGTPVVDLKPYIPSSDRVRDFKVAAWCEDWPEWMEDAGEYFAEHAVDFGE